ncbi:hypothetical protein ACIQTT_02570 [Microbacterium sp. NPDC090225]|uniref:hypothetical protein n=1 Tax=Microbacterium sp. NPDC090225 TaxID=3364207 RepID=UPI00380C9A8B
MKRQIAAWTIAVVAVLGIAGCSSTPGADADKDTTSSSESSAPAEQSTDQSVADACASVGTQISGVATELSSLDMSAAMSDPEGTVATFTETVDAIGAAAESVSNQEVKDAVTAVHEDFTSLRDLLKRVLVDQDTSAAAEASTLTTDIQESTQAFSTLCAG